MFFLLCFCLPQTDPDLYLGQTRMRSGNDLAGFSVWPFMPFSSGYICKDGAAHLDGNIQAAFHLAGSGPARNMEDAGGKGAIRLGTLILGVSLPIPAVVR